MKKLLQFPSSHTALPVSTQRRPVLRAPFPADPERLRWDGPAIRIQLVASKAVREYFERAGQPAPTAFGVALIDTGASHTCVDQEIARELSGPIGLHDFIDVRTPHGKRSDPVLYSEVAFVDLPEWGQQPLRAVVIDLTGQEIDGKFSDLADDVIAGVANHLSGD